MITHCADTLDKDYRSDKSIVLKLLMVESFHLQNQCYILLHHIEFTSVNEVLYRCNIITIYNVIGLVVQNL